MKFRQLDLGKALSLGAYAVSVVVLSTLSVWAALLVGGTSLAMIDRAIIDGSGQADRQPAATETVAGTTSTPSDGPSVEVVPQPTAHVTRTSGPASAPSPQRWPIGTPDEDPATAFHRGSDDTYRTFCVRLCDGYFWPVSFSTTSDRFAQDQETCESSCNSPAKLFVHKMPGGSPSTMTSLDGVPYSMLKTAFLFRTTYNQQCKCQAQPWEQQARDRHRLYAVADAARNGSKEAQTEARELAAKLEIAKKQETRALALATERADKELAALTRSSAARALAAEIASSRRRSAEERAARLAEARQQFGEPMGLGAVEEKSTKSRWIPASGMGRYWKDKVFSGH